MKNVCYLCVCVCVCICVCVPLSQFVRRSVIRRQHIFLYYTSHYKVNAIHKEHITKKHTTFWSLLYTHPLSLCTWHCVRALLSSTAFSLSGDKLVREKVDEIARALAGAEPSLPPANWSHFLMPLLQQGQCFSIHCVLLSIDLCIFVVVVCPLWTIYPLFVDACSHQAARMLVCHGGKTSGFKQLGLHLTTPAVFLAMKVWCCKSYWRETWHSENCWLL